jgi:hypothetical protein
MVDTRVWASEWLSSSRFDSYLRLCDGDPNLALQLHEWNLKLGQSLMGDIAHFELALRKSSASFRYPLKNSWQRPR